MASFPAGSLLTGGSLNAHSNLYDPMAMHQQGQQAQLYNPDIWAPENMKRAIGMRLHIKLYEIMPYKFLECVRLKDDVAVFVVVDQASEPVVLRDGAELFPSDQLITQLRLVK